MTLVNVVRGIFLTSGIYLLLRDTRFRGFIEGRIPMAKPVLNRLIPIGQRAADRVADAVGIGDTDERQPGAQDLGPDRPSPAI